MSLNKRIKGDYTIESVDSGDKIIVHQAGGITIDGDLTVLGTQTSVDSNDTNILDNTIVLNSGESGNGVTAGTSGIEIDRGGFTNVGIRYNEGSDQWEATDDGTIWYPLSTGSGGSGLNNVVEDLTPQLGGDLDVNGFSITSASNGDIVMQADGTGQILINQELSLQEQLTDETPVAGYNKIYAKVAEGGGSGLFVANNATVDELVSRKKAIVFGIIF